MYIHGVVRITHLDTTSVTSVVSVKRGKERRRRGSLVDANAWLRSVLHLLRSCQRPICDRRTVENQSNSKRLRRYRLPLLTGSSRFVCLIVRYLGHTPGTFWDLAELPGDALGRLAVQIGRISSSSLKQFLARNCVFVRKLVAQRTQSERYL